jgi:hypothetical protein
MSEDSVIIKKESFVRIRTQNPKGYMTLAPLQRVVGLTAEPGHVIFDVEPVELSEVHIPLSADSAKTTVLNLEMSPGRWVLVNMSFLDRRHILQAVPPERRFTRDQIVHITYGGC